MSDIPFKELEQMAEAVAQSGIGGFTKQQALVTMLIAQSNGQHPGAGIRDYKMVSGNPSKNAEAMLRDFLDSGGTVEWHQLDDIKVDATFKRGVSVARVAWDKTRAAKAQLLGKKGDMYGKYPCAMYRSRTISEGVRTVYPAATGGLYTHEEAQDIAASAPPDEPMLSDEEAAHIEKLRAHAAGQADLGWEQYKAYWGGIDAATRETVGANAHTANMTRAREVTKAQREKAEFSEALKTDEVTPEHTPVVIGEEPA